MPWVTKNGNVAVIGFGTFVDNLLHFVPLKKIVLNVKKKKNICANWHFEITGYIILFICKGNRCSSR